MCKYNLEPLEVIQLLVFKNFTKTSETFVIKVFFKYILSLCAIHTDSKGSVNMMKLYHLSNDLWCFYD